MAAGIASRFGVDVSLVRLAFVVATAAGGFGLGAYLLAWILIPAGDPGRPRSRLPTGRAAVEVALGTGLLLLAALLTFRALGIWFSDAIVWPLVLIASGGALLWRQSLGGPEPAGGGAAHRVPVEREAARRQAALAAESRRAGGRHLAHRPRHRARDRRRLRRSSRPPAHSAPRATCCSR